MKRLQIIFLGLFVVVFVAIVSMLIFGYGSLRRTLPQVEGSITLQALEDTVDMLLSINKLLRLQLKEEEE